LYREPVIFDGLGVLDFAFVPHVDSPDHPETEALGRVAEHYRRERIPHRVFRDGQVLVINGDDEFVV
jgi:dipeptidase E